MKISEAEREAKQVEYKMREAADLARRSNEARSEAEQAMQLEQETRAAAKDLPGRTRAYLYDTRSVSFVVLHHQLMAVSACHVNHTAWHTTVQLASLLGSLQGLLFRSHC